MKINFGTLKTIKYRCIRYINYKYRFILLKFENLFLLLVIKYVKMYTLHPLGSSH